MSNACIPSLLAADPMRLGDEVARIVQAGAHRVHLDVMDNHYVPTLAFSPLVCKAIRRDYPSLEVDVHLMTNPVDALIEQFALAGANRISIHPDATPHVDRSLQWIQHHGCAAGLVLNPSTTLDCLQWTLHRLSFVVIMTVNPGFSGQRLIPELVDKIRQLRKKCPEIPICVDGGVNHDTIGPLATAGATEFVVGAGLFSSSDYRETLEKLQLKLTLSR